MDFILKEADAEGNGLINASELGTALSVWKQYNDNHQYVEAVFEEYDTDKSGKLDIEEFTHLLITLNDGRDVSIADVEEVMQKVTTALTAC